MVTIVGPPDGRLSKEEAMATPDTVDVWIGRSYTDAPDVDGATYVTGKKLRAGQIVRTEIVAAQGYDVAGAAVGKPR